MFSIPQLYFYGRTDSVLIPDTVFCTPRGEAKMFVKKILVNIHLQVSSMQGEKEISWFNCYNFIFSSLQQGKEQHDTSLLLVLTEQSVSGSGMLTP